MKAHRITMLTIGACFWASIPMPLVFADQLKPRQYQEEQRFKQLLDRLNREGLDYQIKVEYKEFNSSFFGRRHVEGYVHRITLPEEIGRRVAGYDLRFRMGVFPRYIDDPQYSFYSSLLYVFLSQEARGSGGQWGVGHVCPYRLEALEKHDKSLWERDLKRNTARFSGNNRNRNPYREKVLYETIPESYLKDVFPVSIHEFGASIVKWPVDTKGKPYENGVLEFNATSNTAKLLELPLTQENLGVWMYLAISGPETNRLDITKDFCAWCRKSEPKKNAFLSAVMMGLFTVDGYAFDDEKKTYQPNERGKVLLDYLVEFPIPENATRLKIIMDGGNQTLVDDLMKKHSTNQAWQVLLKNPVEPKFVEYKWQPRKKSKR
jgi:hypothetical protein